MKKKHKGILAKRSLRPERPKKDQALIDVQQELQCAHCKTLFPDYLARCPECGSDEWTALTEINNEKARKINTLISAIKNLCFFTFIIYHLIKNLHIAKTLYGG